MESALNEQDRQALIEVLKTLTSLKRKLQEILKKK